MKNRIYTVIMALTGLFVLAGCSLRSIDINYEILAGDYLYLPEDGESIDLTSGSATTFRWAPSIAEDNGWIAYEILFTTENGSFDDDSPFLASQMNGGYTYLSASAKDLNSIASELGLDMGETGTIKWTVRASKALNGVIYSESRTIEVTTLSTLDPIPESLSMYGSACESSSDAVEFLTIGTDGADPEDGVFSVFSQFQSGELTLIDDQGRYIILKSNGTVSSSDSETSSTISLDSGIYWLEVDFNGMTWTASKISSVIYYAASWADNSMSTSKEAMTYTGDGTWELLDFDNEISNNSANDTRHRFNMTMSDGTVWYLGTGATFSGSYTTDYWKVYFYTSDGVGNSDWDKTYYFASTEYGVPLDAYLYLNTTNEAGTCWHEYTFYY